MYEGASMCVWVCVDIGIVYMDVCSNIEGVVKQVTEVGRF